MSDRTDQGRPYVVAVVLTWNDIEMSATCIRSVLDNTYDSTGVVLVDNGSATPGCPILKERFPEIVPVQLDKNYGFTGGCNRGIEKALELGADYVFLLNNDTVVHEDAIAALVEAMEARPDAGFATALLFYPGDERRIQFWQGFMQRDVGRHYHPDDGKVFDERFRETVETEFAPACAVLFRAEALRQVGLFDESLFTNWEDYDLCLRFADAGWKILTVGKAEVIHAHGQTTGRISPFITYFFTRNRLICLFRHGRLPKILRNSVFILRTFYWQMREYGWTNWPAHGALLKGILAFVFGVRGKGGVPASRKDRA
ncbi:MAG: glycosyltransferase family 2 protein [bacterium]|nr:glycosyltransferase family 2 protein [bacterium]